MIDHLSPSQIRMYLRCPRQWEYRYVKGLKIPPSGAMVLGSAYHEGLAKRFQYVLDCGKQPPPALATDTLAASFERLRADHIIANDEESETFDEILWEEEPGKLKDIGIRLIQTYEQDVAPLITPVGVEVREVLLIGSERAGEIPIHLITDLEIPDAVIDHKVKKRVFSSTDLEQDLQATVYWMATGLPLSFHVALKQKTPKIVMQPTQRSDDHAIWFARQAESIWMALRSGVFPPNNQGWHCNERFCGYYGVCKSRKQ